MLGRARRSASIAVIGVAGILVGCGTGDGVDFDAPEMPDTPPTMAPGPPEMDLDTPGG